MEEGVFAKLKEEMRGAIAHLQQETAAIRAGRANPSLVENIQVDCYGMKTPLKQVASLSAPQANLITIEPWDKNLLGSIGKAIEQSDLNLAPIAEGNIIRLMLPPLSDERRQQLIKLLHEKTEAARITIRQRREEALRSLQKMKEGKEIGEDAWFRAKEKVQKEVDEVNGSIKTIAERKESEINGS